MFVMVIQSINEPRTSLPVCRDLFSGYTLEHLTSIIVVYYLSCGFFPVILNFLGLIIFDISKRLNSCNLS